MNIAIHNLHKFPHLTNTKIHNYGVELIKKGYVKYLYFDGLGLNKSSVATIKDVMKFVKDMYQWKDLGLDKVEMIFSSKRLNSNCDVLLNFNGTYGHDFTENVRNFNGLKIFHLMDYFWVEPGSQKYKRLKDYGVDYIFSYGRPDKHCPYFQKYFPSYIGEVIPLPFGFAPRFVNKTPFRERKKKCVALGAVVPFRLYDADEKNYIETANFYRNEKWLHKFRRMLVENRKELSGLIDSMFPVFPKYKDFSYDIVAKLNKYQMFVTDETMFYFPTAKTYEGPASGTVMVCSDHPCFDDFGFIDGVNCIKHRQFDIENFKEKIAYYIKNQEKLEEIQKKAVAFVREKYSHRAIADKLYAIISNIYQKRKNQEKIEFDNLWTNNSFYKYPNIQRKASLGAKNKVFNYLIFKLLSFGTNLYNFGRRILPQKDGDKHQKVFRYQRLK